MDEAQALFLTISYFLLLAAPWLYSYNRQLFNAIAVALLVILGFFLICAVFIAILAYFHSLLDQ